MADLKKIKCPACRRVGDWFATPFGPFCSRRCKLIDLGQWFDEANKISEPLRPDHFQEYESLPPGEHLDRPEEEQER